MTIPLKGTQGYIKQLSDKWLAWTKYSSKKQKAQSFRQGKARIFQEAVASNI